jgi:hypothetical protein
MSKQEILSELPKLSAEERAEILEELWHLEESGGPTARERAVLDEAQTEFDANPTPGVPWREVEVRLRGKGA